MREYTEAEAKMAKAWVDDELLRLEMTIVRAINDFERVTGLVLNSSYLGFSRRRDRDVSGSSRLGDAVPCNSNVAGYQPIESIDFTFIRNGHE
jgi:hypothetical protein